jgi:hypothetical protein
MFDDWGILFVFYSIICAIIGWSLIEGILWIIRHISIVWN